MPRNMRHRALFSSLSFQAKRGAVLGLESYPSVIKTKQAFTLLKKLPIELGRHILVVTPERHEGLMLSMRNIPHVKTILVNYLNPEDVLKSRHLIFLVDALAKAEEIFLAPKRRVKEVAEVRGAGKVVDEPKRKEPTSVKKPKKQKTSQASLTSQTSKTSK
jgi:predicted phosphatase